MCSAGSSAGRQIQPWEYARGWPRAKPQQRGSARLCPQRGADRGAAGLLSRGTKVGALGSIRHSHFTTEVPIYVGLFFSFNIFSFKKSGLNRVNECCNSN